MHFRSRPHINLFFVFVNILVVNFFLSWLILYFRCREIFIITSLVFVAITLSL